MMRLAQKHLRGQVPAQESTPTSKETSRSPASLIPAMRHAPKYTIPWLILGIWASGSNITVLATAANKFLHIYSGVLNRF
jgi:hypothetical protein